MADRIRRPPHPDDEPVLPRREPDAEPETDEPDRSDDDVDEPETAPMVR